MFQPNEEAVAAPKLNMTAIDEAALPRNRQRRPAA
jgi:hypothetical protein